MAGMMVASPPALLRSRAVGAAQQDAAGTEGFCASLNRRGNSARRILFCVKLSGGRQDISGAEIELRRPE
jgi:hypothetical protein